jgi:hypothetical protein
MARILGFTRASATVALPELDEEDICRPGIQGDQSAYGALTDNIGGRLLTHSEKIREIAHFHGVQYILVDPNDPSVVILNL